MPPQTRHINPQCSPAPDYSSLLNVIWGYATQFLCYRCSIMRTILIDFSNNDIHYGAVYAWFHRPIRCAQYSFKAHAVTLSFWQWYWRFYSSTFTGSVGVLVVRHVHTFTFKRLSVSDIRRSISGCLHMYISSYTKDFLLSSQRYLFLLLTANSETKNIWRLQPHNTHDREMIPHHRLEVCISRVQVVCVVTSAILCLSVR